MSWSNWSISTLKVNKLNFNNLRTFLVVTGGTTSSINFQKHWQKLISISIFETGMMVWVILLCFHLPNESEPRRGEAGVIYFSDLRVKLSRLPETISQPFPTVKTLYYRQICLEPCQPTNCLPPFLHTSYVPLMFIFHSASAAELDNPSTIQGFGFLPTPPGSLVQHLHLPIP